MVLPTRLAQYPDDVGPLGSNQFWRSADELHAIIFHLRSRGDADERRRRRVVEHGPIERAAPIDDTATAADTIPRP